MKLHNACVKGRRNAPNNITHLLRNQNILNLAEISLKAFTMKYSLIPMLDSEESTHNRPRLACTRDLGLSWCTSLFNGWIMIVHKFYHVLHAHEYFHFNFSFSLTVPFCPSSLPDFVTVK
jgi:hypothetical protein